MLRLSIGLMLAIAPVAAAAQEWRQAREVELRLSDFDISPSPVRLRSGEPVRLRLVNITLGDRTLSAPRFFGAARMRSRDARWVKRGRIAVAGGEARELLLVPSAGRYRLSSTNFLARLLGMSGEIIVE